MLQEYIPVDPVPAVQEFGYVFVVVPYSICLVGFSPPVSVMFALSVADLIVIFDADWVSTEATDDVAYETVTSESVGVFCPSVDVRTALYWKY